MWNIKMQISLGEVATLVQGVVVGDPHIMVSRLSPIDAIACDSLVFADNEENLHIAENSMACAILLDQHLSSTKKAFIQVEHSFDAFLQLLEYFYPDSAPTLGIHPTACISPEVQIGQHISIGPYVVIESGSIIGDYSVIKSHVYIGHDVNIGAHSVLHPHVVIYDRSQLGQKVIIHASTVIGSDGFGYRLEQGKHKKVPHKGRVVIENGVEIGANTVIDRATLGATCIGEGTKIDNLVQIAHSVKLGKHNILCAFTGIAGRSTSGNHVIFAANVGVSDHVRIEDGVVLGARTGVPPGRHLKQGNVYLGNPSRLKDKAIELELSVTRVP